MLDNRKIILDILVKHHAKFCKEVEELASKHNKSYDEVAEEYDRLRDKRKSGDK